MKSTDPNQTFPPRRPSLSADASRAAETERLKAMTVEARMRLALSLHRQLEDLKPFKVRT